MKKMMCVLFILSCVYSTSNSFDPEDPQSNQRRIETIENRLHDINEELLGIERSNQGYTIEVQRIRDLSRVNRERSAELFQQRESLSNELNSLAGRL